MCRETCVYSAAVRDVLIHLALCWIQGTVHSYIKQSGIQQPCNTFSQFSKHLYRSRQDHQVELSWVSIQRQSDFISAYTPFHFSFTVSLRKDFAFTKPLTAILRRVSKYMIAVSICSLLKGSDRLCKVVELSMQCCGKLLSDSFETY